MPLTAYRRHTTSCIKGYGQNTRIFFPSTNALRKLDCECPIAVEGKLGNQLLTNRSTKKTTWEEALAIVDQWEEWGDTQCPEADQQENPTVEYAMKRFLTSIGPTGRNIEESSQRQYKVLINQRLLPWCKSKQYTLLREFDSLDTTTKFTESWVNLNPTRGKKNVPAPKTPVLLKDSSKKGQLEMLRIVFQFCRERGWLEHNRAKEIKFHTKIAKKFGLEVHEEDWFLEEVDRFTDGHYRSGQTNALELKAFWYIMRHAGLRISDAVTFNDTALVPRVSGEGWAAKIYQKKTKEWVYIPIPPYVETLLRKLPFKGEKDGKRYWFWTTEGKTKTAEANWYARIMKIVRRVEEGHGKHKALGKFAHPVTPHSGRHTFSIRHLNAGTDIKLVSRWLGHQHVTVTEEHYSHAIEGTMLASEEAYDASMRRQEELAAKHRRGRMKLTK